MTSILNAKLMADHIRRLLAFHHSPPKALLDVKVTKAAPDLSLTGRAWRAVFDMTTTNGGHYKITVEEVPSDRDPGESEPTCGICKRPYSRHSTALSLRSADDPTGTWYTDDGGERCPPTNGKINDTIYCTPEARAAAEKGV